jgi:dolichol-phosphate mannosyltransferase
MKSDHSQNPPDLTVVMPVLDEAENLPEVFRRLVPVLEQEGSSFEVLFVDDGSTDLTVAIIEERARVDPRIRAISLTRNFGHQAAVSAGLAHARGRAVLVMDADLQDPPEVLPQFIQKWREGNQVVYAVRRKRKEGPLMRLAYHVYYRILASAASIDIPLDSGDFCLMDRQVVDAINALPERDRFVRGLRAWVGWRQTPVEYERHARHAGRSKYSLRQLYYLGAQGIISFSIRPLRLATKIGFAMALISILVGLGYFVWRIFGGDAWPPGFATLFVAMSFFFGIQFILLGIVGEYVGQVLVEVKGRPTWLVGRQVGFEHSGSRADGRDPIAARSTVRHTEALPDDDVGKGPTEGAEF